MMSDNKTIVLSATAFGWLVVVAAMSWGESRYHDGYRAAEAKAEKQRNEAAEQINQQKYQASKTYQAAKAEREAAQQIRKDFIRELAQTADYRRLCFDAGGLQQFDAATAKK